MLVKKMGTKNLIIAVMLVFIGIGTLRAQTYFDESKLPFPKKYGPEIKAKFKEELVYEFKVDEGKHAIFLRNGLRSSQFIAPQLWLNARDTLYPYRVDIVYSRYPVFDGVYHEIYPLLCNRLIHLFEMDPALNDANLEWRTILQTHIETDDQVNSLFHGVVIWYRTQEEEQKVPDPKESTVPLAKLDQKDKSVQGGMKETLLTIETLKESTLINDSVKMVISNKPIDVQKQIIKKHLDEEVKKASTIPLKDRSPVEMFQFKRQIGEYLKSNPFSDSVVWKVMDRHPEWVDALVVNDWTGSMYGYGAQVVHWHLLHYQNTGIRYLTLFNDGDMKPNASKIIGSTGGIYFAEASDIPTILNLFNLVRLNGSGGDRQENDIEAILASMEKFPNHKEIILIADNLACIRDIELAVKINKPVRVIICGYNKETGINPNLAYLAKVTNGGLYTLEEDYESLKLETSITGEITSFKDKRFVLSPIDCNKRPGFDFKYTKESFKTYTHLDSALREKMMVRQLDLHEQQLLKYPTGISKMKNLLSLNLSNTHIQNIPSNIKNLENLKDLDLSGNNLVALPKNFGKLKYLESLNLNQNQLGSLSMYFENWYYLRKLFIGSNRIESLENINQLKNLQTLNASDNNISELPPEIHQLKRLVTLDLSNNRLLFLPKTFCGLSKLEELNLENNQLGSLPPYLYRLRKLKVLNLAGNPLGEKEKERIRKDLPNVEIKK